MPYYFYEPIFRALMKMAVADNYEGMNLNRLVLRIVLERLQKERLFKHTVAECLHETLYTAKNRKVIMCEDCGTILDWTGDRALVDQKIQRKRDTLGERVRETPP